MAIFKDRTDAGKKLILKLEKYKDHKDVIVLGLPRGGVPVAFEVAKYLKVPQDIFIVRKLGVPGQEELAFGAISSDGVRVLNKEIINLMKIPKEVVEKVTEIEKQELLRREQLYKGDKPPITIAGKIVILVDDGLATGASMRAAITALKILNPKKIVLAVPTASSDTCEDFENEVDEVICASTPEPFRGVGFWYEDFSQIKDEQVKKILSYKTE